MPHIVFRNVPPPGGYGDGQTYLRVNRALAGSRWPRPGYRCETADTRLRADPEHDYIPAINSHNAFAYRMWLRMDGVPVEALTVVRVATQP